MKMAELFPLSESIFTHFNPIALRMAKTPYSFGHSECNRIKISIKLSSVSNFQLSTYVLFQLLGTCVLF